MIILTILAIIFIFIDGYNLFASICCFVLPALKCLEEVTSDRYNSNIPLLKINSEEQMSHLSDEEYSQVAFSNKSRIRTI